MTTKELDNYQEFTIGSNSLSKSHLNQGFIHYYFGDGKGKTTSLIGLIIRALGHGLKPILIQFLKKHDKFKSGKCFFLGEINFLKEFMEIKQFGNGKFLDPNEKNKDEDINSAQKGFSFAKEVILSGKYDLIGLDEIINAISLKLLDLEDLIELLKEKPKHVEVICTGFMFYRRLRDISHYVISFNSMSHPYKNGIMARKGIEY